MALCVHSGVRVARVRGPGKGVGGVRNELAWLIAPEIGVWSGLPRWSRPVYLDAAHRRWDGQAEGADGGVDLLDLLQNDRVQRLLRMLIELAGVIWILLRVVAFLTGSRGSVAVLSEWSGFAILAVLQMQRDGCFRPVSATRNRGNTDTFNGDTSIGQDFRSFESSIWCWMKSCDQG